MGLVVIAALMFKLCNNDNKVVTILLLSLPEPRMRFGLYWDSLNVDSGSLNLYKPSPPADPFGITPARLHHLQQIVRTFTRSLQ